jgi:hypothetical protein
MFGIMGAQIEINSFLVLLESSPIFNILDWGLKTWIASFLL